MPVAARIQIDRILTGHTCSMIAGIAGPGAPKVIVMGAPVACATDAIKPHTIRAGDKCVSHTAVINTGALGVIAQGRPVARIGDSADAGIVISGAFKVFVGNL